MSSALFEYPCSSSKLVGQISRTEEDGIEASTETKVRENKGSVEQEKQSSIIWGSRRRWILMLQIVLLLQRDDRWGINYGSGVQKLSIPIQRICEWHSSKDNMWLSERSWWNYLHRYKWGRIQQEKIGSGVEIFIECKIEVTNLLPTTMCQDITWHCQLSDVQDGVCSCERCYLQWVYFGNVCCQD